MVVLSTVQRVHLPGGPTHSPAMEGVRLPLLPEGAGACSQRPQAEGAEGRKAGEAGVRRYLHDRGQRLGRGTDIWANNYRKDSRKYTFTLSKYIYTTLKRVYTYYKFIH